MRWKHRSAARKPPRRRTVSSPAQLSFDFTENASLVPLVIPTPLQRELLARALERIAKKEDDALLEAAVLPQAPLSSGTARCSRASSVPYSVRSYYRCALFHPETITMTVYDPGPRSPPGGMARLQAFRPLADDIAEAVFRCIERERAIIKDRIATSVWVQLVMSELLNGLPVPERDAPNPG